MNKQTKHTRLWEREVEPNSSLWCVHTVTVTDRHYQPIGMVKRLLDSMSYAKLNLLHWHAVDDQSFPITVERFPKQQPGQPPMARINIGARAETEK